MKFDYNEKIMEEKQMEISKFSKFIIFKEIQSRFEYLKMQVDSP